MMDNEALRMIAEQMGIKNLLTAIKLQSASYNSRNIPGKYADIAKGIAFDSSFDSSVMDGGVDPLYQIAMQMKIENMMEGLTFLMRCSKSPAEKAKYEGLVENLIDSYGQSRGIQ